MSIQYDAIVIGTGAGGGTLALHLARAGKNILILERGPFMPQEKLNWDTQAVFLDNRYHTKETWQDKEGKDLHPQQAYYVGGQTKVYGAAMFRMRAEDFGVIQHKGGVSPAWPISYADMEPYYTRAEELFHVHGDLGSAPSLPGGFGSSFDPSEPFHSKTYPYPAFSNEPRMQTIEEDVRKLGINTFPIPARTQAQRGRSACFQMRALRYMRWLSLPRPRQIGCRHQLHPRNYASAERYPDDQLTRGAPHHQCSGYSRDRRGGAALRLRQALRQRV